MRSARSKKEDNMIFEHESIPDESLRDRLVAAALEWQDRFAVAPSITSALSEYDAAMPNSLPS
jgi:hypothetical protein